MKTIKEIDVVTLKSLAYDNLAQIEQCQANIKAINEELQSRQAVETKDTKSDTKKAA